MLTRVRLPLAFPLDTCADVSFSYKDPQPRYLRVHRHGRRHGTDRDSPPPPTLVRGQERSVRLCPIKIGSGPRLWSQQECHQRQRDDQRGLRPATTNPEHQECYRKAARLEILKKNLDTSMAHHLKAGRNLGDAEVLNKDAMTSETDFALQKQIYPKAST